MKNTILIVAASLFIAAAANAQTTTDSSKHNTTVSTTSTTPVATAQVSVPDNLKGVTSETLRPENYLPALGHYQASGTSTGDVTITLDPDNKGIVWVDGLPQGKIKALLLKGPATYKIPIQKTADGKLIPEGTLYVDPSSSQLSIVIGVPYNSADPIAVFTNNMDATVKVKSVTNGKKVKEKEKPWMYTGTKVKEAGAQ